MCMWVPIYAQIFSISQENESNWAFKAVHNWIQRKQEVIEQKWKKSIVFLLQTRRHYFSGLLIKSCSKPCKSIYRQSPTSSVDKFMTGSKTSTRATFRKTCQKKAEQLKWLHLSCLLGYWSIRHSCALSHLIQHCSLLIQKLKLKYSLFGLMSQGRLSAWHIIKFYKHTKILTGLFCTIVHIYP